MTQFHPRKPGFPVCWQDAWCTCRDSQTMGEGVRVERSGTPHYREAGTPSDRWSVTSVAGVVAENPKPYTVPRVMHPPPTASLGNPACGIP